MAPSSLLVLVLSLVLLLALPARPGKVAEILQKGRERELRDGASGEAHGAARGAGTAAAWEMRDGAWQAVDEAGVAALYSELRHPRDAAECREAGAHLGGAASAARPELQWRSHTCVQSQGLSLAAAPGATNESAKAALRASEEVLNKPKMQAYRARPLGSDVAARPAGGCDGLSARQRGTFSAAEAVEFSSIVESVRAGRWVRLASIEPTSQFVLMHVGSRGTAGRKVESAHIVERFFNGHSWVFLRHSLLPTMGSVASIFCHSSRLYAVNTLGQLWERRRTRTATYELEWAQLHFMPHLDAAAPPVLSGRHRSPSVFLLDVYGQLVDLRGLGCVACGDTGESFHELLGQRLRPHIYSYNSNRAAPDPSLAQLRYWKTSGIPGTLPGEPAPSEWWADRVAERPVAIADAETLEPNLIFLIGEFGSLIEVQLTQRFWRAQYRNLGHPARRPLAPVAGIALKRANNGRGKRGPSRYLVLLALSGEVVEYRIPAAPDAAELYEWVVVGYPEPGLSVVAIGPAIVSNMFPGDPPLMQEMSLLFCVGADGRVYELSRRKDRWAWQEHFHPGFGTEEPGPSPWYNRLEGVPGVTAALFSPVWLTKDNSLATKVPRSPTEWTWKVIELPEVGGAKWCSPDPSAPDSCMPKPQADDDASDDASFDVTA